MITKKKYLFFQSLTLSIGFVIYFANKLPSFLDEFVSLSSHYFFITEFDLRSPIGGEENLPITSFSPGLTSVFNSSIGGAISWLFIKDFHTSRIFNFIFTIFQLNLLNLFAFKKKLINEFFVILSNLSIFLIPWWFGSLYGLGEVSACLIFFYGILFYESNKKISLLLISFSIVFGKFILLLSFLVLFFLNLRKDGLKVFLYSLVVPIFWQTIIFFKLGNEGYINYLISYKSFLFSQGVGNTILNTNFMNFIQFIIKSEISEWTAATLLRAVIVPFVLFLILFKMRKNRNFLIQNFQLIILINYVYFFLFSQYKWIRYAQPLLIFTIYLILYIVTVDQRTSFNIKILTFILFLLFLSSELLIILGLLSLSLTRLKNLKINFNLSLILIFLLSLNILNLLYESLSIPIYQTFYNTCSIENFTLNCALDYMEQISLTD